MKIIFLNSLIILTIVSTLSSCGSKYEEQSVDSEKIESKSEVPGAGNLGALTVDEFFEYAKNPVLQKEEMIGEKTPYYSRRLIEVKVSNSREEIESAMKVAEQPGKEIKEVNKIPTKISKEQSEKLNKIADVIHETFMGKNKIDKKKVENYIKYTPYVEISNEAEMALAVLKANQLAFELSIEGGMPLGYTDQLRGLTNDSLFVPTYLSQETDPENNVQQVQFIFNTILFRIYPMQQDDYYDSQIITAAANMALRSKRSDKRYYQLKDDRHVILATPKEMMMLCTKFGFEIK